METYTPSQGTTQQGQQQSNMQQLLQTIQNMPASSVPAVTPNQVAQTQSNAFNFQQQIPALTQQSQQSLTQQSGIPNLQNQQQNLGQIFQLYLHDQNLGQKYASTQLSTPNSPVFNSNLQPNQGMYTGETSAVPNPYLAKTSDLINAIVQPSGQGFQGFTNPNLNTQALNQVPSAAQNIIGILNNALGTEQGLVTQKMGDVSQNYQTALNTLTGIANIFSQTYQNQQLAKSGGGSGGISGTSQEAAGIYQTLKDNFVSQMEAEGKEATPDGFWYFLNSQKNALAAQGIDVNEIYKLQAQDRQMIGGNGSLSSGAKAGAKSSNNLQKITVSGQVVGTFNPKTGETKYTSQLTPQQVDSFTNIHDSASKILKDFENMSYIERSVPGMEHFSPARASINSEITGLISDLRKTAVGGRITQQEIRWLSNRFPQPGDTNSVAEAKIKVIQDEIEKKLTQGGYSIGGSGGASGSSKDPMGIL